MAIVIPILGDRDARLLCDADVLSLLHDIEAAFLGSRSRPSRGSWSEWVGACKENWYWMLEYADQINREFKYRFSARNGMGFDHSKWSDIRKIPMGLTRGRRCGRPTLEDRPTIASVMSGLRGVRAVGSDIRWYPLFRVKQYTRRKVPAFWEIPK